MQPADRLHTLRLMIESRLGDLREQSLIRQGRGWFQVSAMGHEALVVAGQLLVDGDFFAGYYRDRPIAIGRGVDCRELALDFLAKRASANGGRQMPAHFNCKERGIFSIASVVGSSLLPACGLAWGLQLDQQPNLVLTTVGDAGSRQGDLYEAVCFARERQLPVVFMVEDNGIGISSRTAATNPLALGVFDSALWQRVDGRDPDRLRTALATVFDEVRAGSGPRCLWVATERLSSHSSADDQRKYRDSHELDHLAARDPLLRYRDRLIADGLLSIDSYNALWQETEQRVRTIYDAAAADPDPQPDDVRQHITAPSVTVPAAGFRLEPKARMVDAINATFHRALDTSGQVVFFGQDIADPKGGVFSFTRGLSSKRPSQAFNAPLAESTIVGAAVGLAAYGKRPVFEIQFVDYIWAGFNQLATHLSTLHWRSNGAWNAPAVIYAPYGAYLPGGALWHSQSNESALAHFPGIHIAIPSTPSDAAGLFWSAIHGSTPTIILIPKHRMWQAADDALIDVEPVPLGKAALRRAGSALTIVGWGNTLEIIDQALAAMPDVDPEIIDLRSIVPLDLETITESVVRTGRLLVVQEDNAHCSVGQAIISGVVDSPAFNRLHAAPRLLARQDVNIGYNPVLEYAALPSANDVALAVRTLLACVAAPRSTGPAQPDFTSASANPVSLTPPTSGAPADPQPTPPSASPMQQEIRVPVLGEGITAARVVSLLVQSGDHIERDAALCELETDKAVFPVESPFAGTFDGWLIADGDEVEVGQVIARLAQVSGVLPIQTPLALNNHQPRPAQAAPPASRPSEGGLPDHVVRQFKNVVPAHMSLRADWLPVRTARAAARAAGEDVSPTAIVAFAIARAIVANPVFRCTVSTHGDLIDNPQFDLGVAVALPNDALDTAVVPKAGTLDWPAFNAAYSDAVATVRAGRSRSKANVPVILTSMGGHGVRDALPVVVPPAIATLFLGEAHFELASDGSSVERVALCLSFDHRWLNGVAAAQFLQAIRQQLGAIGS
jgi:2-oxoisovalerate dehydrogenase E1 component